MNTRALITPRLIIFCKTEEKMEFFKSLISNHALIVAVASWAISQILKFFTNLAVSREFDWRRITSDGGMPSAHSATVTSLAIMVGYIEKVGSAAFALAMIFAIVVMRDAVGVRREAGKQAKSIKDIADAINGTFVGKDKEIRTENLKLLVGHTPLQVVFGAFLGALVAILYIVIFL